MPALPRPRRGRRAAIVLVAAIVIIVWNAMFDARMKAAIVQYVDQQHQYVAGEGQRVDVDQAMQSGVRRGLRDATLAAVLTGALAAAAVRRWGSRGS